MKNRQQTKSLKNAIMDDRSGSAYLMLALKVRPAARGLQNNKFNIKYSGSSRKGKYINKICKYAARRKQTAIFARQL